ncbi:hypothetical protein GOHSU_16_00570 [Gordonia hirsuta DSM 44140 = NBRC 16056]|uniref:Uncharacterized protein n=1 Tax=Gordonia hirsuta DSM 44140 = NBRC 16056 TaxID=1121927 RepID=L7L8N1_9ACTN|nr:hypothetical protein [Gordonia hirsuta]GAC57101.1 hypothetical protein GOHSU_16_00570 [Gordonia hirsuta DSM 44140 = NBRC 16056]
MARYEFPTTAELLEMGAPKENAVTIYVPATAAEYDVARTAVKSSMDQAIRTLRERGADHAIQESFHAITEWILEDPCWDVLSRSLAIFATADGAEIFVLPNNLEHQLQVGKYWDLGQIVRSVANPQRAYAVTLSANEWHIWSASGTDEAHELKVDEGDFHDARAHGDERTQTLESYAKRVAAKVESVLIHADPTSERPLFLFATDPLEGMFREAFSGRREVVLVPGSPDDLRPDQVDQAIREGLTTINARRATETVDTIADGISKGLVATDLADIARAAVAGAVDTLVYDFTVDTLGRLDGTNGDLTFSDEGYDLMSRIAMVVLQNGGKVVPVRAAEVDSEIWNDVAVARLRYPLAR